MASTHVLSYAAVSAFYWVWLDEELKGGMGVAAVMTVVTAVMTVVTELVES